MARKAQGFLATSDAIAIGVVNGTRVGGTRRPNTYARASECISYTREDKSDARIFRAARADSTRAKVAKTETVADRNRALISSLPSITEGSY